VNAATKERRSWRGLLIPAVTAFAVLVALGTWQLERKAWKENLIATLTERLAAAPVALPPPSAWPSLDPATDEYRGVKLTASFDHGKEALVYATASAFRPDVSGAGYWVFAPARLADGALVMVNRGFVSEVRKGVATRAVGQIAGPVGITGAMRWPEAHHWYTPVDDPAHKLWYSRDTTAIAAAEGIRPVAQFYVEQESPVPPGGLPQPGKLVVRLPNNHLQYAMTWYGLALALVVVFAVWVRKSRRESDSSPPTSCSL